LTTTMFESLLTPTQDARRNDVPLTSDTVSDLDIPVMARAMAHIAATENDIVAVLGVLPQDEATIRYRQETVQSLWKDQALLSKLQDSVGPMRELTLFSRAQQEARPLLEAVWRLGELELYVELVLTLGEALSAAAGRQALGGGLSRLLEELRQRGSDPMFVELAAELPSLRAGLKQHQSITLGINLDNRLRPVEAALLSINEKPFREGQLLSGFFGAGGDPYVTQTPLHGTPQRSRDGVVYERLPLAPLFQELDTVMKSVLRPLARRLRSYVSVNSEVFRRLSSEIAFFAAVISHLKRLDADGYPMCFPSLRPADERVAIFRNLYNLRLASHWMSEKAPNTMVRNDAVFDDSARLHVLTGPNGGGKTTFTQAVGMAVALGQNGFPVPAEQAVLSPVDRLFTHFAGEEQISDEIGRFEEEARRLAAIFSDLSDRSMVLLNEPLSSTGPNEAEQIAGAVLCGLAAAGARGIFTTHFHHLASVAEGIGSASGSASGNTAIGTLNAGVRMIDGKAERTYRIESGPPSGHSYAEDIAKRYGIDRDSLERRFGAPQ
jgi:DNA mismatch repair protein MutS